MLIESLDLRPASLTGLDRPITLWSRQPVPASVNDGGCQLQVVGHAGCDTSVGIEVPLGDADGFWSPLRTYRTTHLPADWSGREDASVAHSAAIGCLYDAGGNSLLSYAADGQDGCVQVRFGVWEEAGSFVIVMTFPAGERHWEVMVRTDAEPYETAIRALSGWLASRQPDCVVSGGPEQVREPVFSTWYAFGQDVSDQAIETEACLAVELGMRSVFVDDGWQQGGSGRGYAGCGDWLVDQAKFPDIARHTGRLRGLGLAPVVWVAPLLVGRRSAAYAKLRDYIGRESANLEAGILDPRFPQVREHAARVCAQSVADHGFAGLKLDFLDACVDIAEDAADADEISRSVDVMLAQIVAELSGRGVDNPIIEFRQGYVGPRAARFCNAMRVADCPGDATRNRVALIDLRLGLGGAGPVAHSDMLMWGASASPAAVARQLRAAFFGVPQISVMLSTTPDAQRAVLRAQLALWERLKSVLLDGEVWAATPASNYHQVVASKGAESVALVSDVPLLRLPESVSGSVVVLNSTASDQIAVTSAVGGVAGGRYESFGPAGEYCGAGVIGGTGRAGGAGVIGAEGRVGRCVRPLEAAATGGTASTIRSIPVPPGGHAEVVFEQ